MEFIFGLFVGAGLLALILWLNQLKIPVKWYEWLSGTLGLILLLAAIHEYSKSMLEHNEIAATTFFWLLGVPALLLIALPCASISRRYTAKIKGERNEEASK